jgi:hypothetical protein
VSDFGLINIERADPYLDVGHVRLPVAKPCSLGIARSTAMTQSNSAWVTLNCFPPVRNDMRELL